jgi:ribose-phosphate pyrophosphokinase
MMELLVMLDALKRASADRVTAIMPYFGYARQDRKDRPRVPITAKLVANLITSAGADRVLTMDLHAHQIQGFFDIPLDHLYALPVFIDDAAFQKIADPVIVAPDVGALKMARGFATRLEADLAVVDKRRVDHQKTEVMNILGDVAGRNVIIVDDIIATAGSVTEAAAALKAQGANDVYAAITHGILSGPAIERLAASPIQKLWVTDSVLLTKEQQHPKIGVVSIAPLLAEAIKRIHRAESISSLFN